MTPCCLHAWLHSSTIAGGCEIYIALKPGLNPSKPIEDKIVRAIETSIGKTVRPKGIHIV
jgi:acyl-coenzyme A synthetase/AMP-(fatty) acid ligase